VVPWKFVHQSKKATNSYVLEIDQAELRDTGDFERPNWPLFEKAWYQTNYAHFGWLALTSKAKPQVIVFFNDPFICVVFSLINVFTHHGPK